MALIKCLECGKEISDKAKVCPNCGCPVGTTSTKKEKKLIKPAPIIISLAIVLLIGCISYFMVIQPRINEAKKLETYENAMVLLENGNYEDGKSLLESLSLEYKDVSATLDKIKLESYVFDCINKWKANLVKPSSFEFVDVKLYEMTSIDAIPGFTWFSSGVEQKEDFYNDIKDYPAIIMQSSSETRSGGMAHHYQLFIYSNSNEEYWCAGYCYSLDEGDYSGNLNDEMVSQCQTMYDITCIVENGKEINNLDKDRIITVLDKDAYSEISMLK